MCVRVRVQVGYCGADLKALCTEAAMRALRRRYPQIYTSSQKLVIKQDEVMVLRADFADAMRAIQPAAHRWGGREAVRVVTTDRR
jgi:SpoVK/Ycf46/Vps4 family AAA+-type ATPase